jgi:hypothetical protein
LSAGLDAWLNPRPPAKGTLDVAYDRLIKARTLTNLYNGLVYYRETTDHRRKTTASGSSGSRRSSVVRILTAPPSTSQPANPSPRPKSRNSTTSTAPSTRPFSAPTAGRPT